MLLAMDAEGIGSRSGTGDPCTRYCPRVKLPGMSAVNTMVQILDPLVAQQVAAGEVVDRPASVVKELVENSLDAGAARIEVELADGGTASILVRDDGAGMTPEDAKLAVLRHATSKIRSVSDLETVATLGFRGEALPSIASVSSFSLTTSTAEEGTGARVRVEGGAGAEASAARHPKGTTVVAERLFYNVPARRAFLKTARAERAAIMAVVTHLAIVHPEVAFKLAEANKALLALPAASSLKERLAQVHGVGEARALREVPRISGSQGGVTDGIHVSGYVALPSLTKTNRAGCQTVCVNGRWVRAESLSRAIDDGYRATVAPGRYPPLALRLEVDPRRVDVNVHPTKQIVRFSSEAEKLLRALVADAIRVDIGQAGQPTTRSPIGAGGAGSTARGGPARGSSRWTEADLQARLGAPGEQSAASRRDGSSGAGHAQRQSARLDDSSGHDGPGARDGSLRDYQRRLRTASEQSEQSGQPPSEGVSRASQSVEDQADGASQSKPPASASPPDQQDQQGAPRGALPDPGRTRVIGQFDRGYILLEEQTSPGALWVVDQHAAHERAILDRLMASEEPPAQQALLTPEVARLSLEEAAEAVEYLEDLAMHGFEAEAFGRDAFRISAVPQLVARRGDVIGAFLDALGTLLGSGGEGLSRAGRVTATVACKAAVKLGDRLTQPELESLIEQWLSSDLPATCPHGRTICYRIASSELARKLDRT